MQEMVKYLSATMSWEVHRLLGHFLISDMGKFWLQIVSIQVTPLLLEKNQQILLQGSNMQCICVTWLLMAAISSC
jgi:hypothetical protein